MDLLDIYAKLTLDTDDYESGIKNAEESLDDFGGSTEKANKKSNRAISGMSAISVATGNIISSAFSSATSAVSGFISDSWDSTVEFEKSMAQVETIMDTTQMSTDDMSRAIKKLSSSMGISADDIASSVYGVISATGDTANSVSLVEQATKLAKGGFADTESAVSVLTTAMNSYGLSAEEAEHISDSLITVQNLGVTTVGELSTQMGKAIATGAAYGVNLENLETGYIALTKAGIGTAESTTYMSSMINELGDSGSTVAGILQEKTGKSFGQLMEDGYSLSDVLGILNDSVDGDSEALANLWSSAEAGKASSAIASQGLENFNTWLNEVENSAGATESAYATMSDTTSDKMSVLKESFTNLATSALEPLNEKFSEVLEGAISFVEGIDMSAAQEAVETAMGAIGAAIDLVSPLFASLGETISSLVESATTDGTLLNEIFTGFQTVVETTIGVITGIIDGITALFNGDFSGAIDAVGSVFDTVFGGLGELVEGAINTVTGAVQGVVDFFNGGFTDAVNGVTGLFEGVFGGLGDIVTGAFEGASEWFSGVTDVVGSVFDGITETAVSWAGSVAGFVGNAVNGAIDTVSGWAEAIGDFLFGSDDVDEAMEAFDGMAEGMGESAGDAETTISENFNDIKTIVSDSSTEAVEAVSQAYVGMANDIESALGTAYKSVVTKMNDIETKITSSTTSAVSSAGSSLNTLQSKWVSAMSDIKNTVSRYMDQIKELLNQEFSIKVAIEGGSEGGSVKKFAKAMNSGYILNGATVFGEMGGTPLVGGEAGQEMIVGTNTMMNMISQAAGGGQAAAMVQSYGEQVVAILAEYLPTLGNQKIYLNGTALVGGIANDMDKQLGKLAYQRGMVGV